MQDLNEDLIDFLLKAKRSTYASQGDEASVIAQLNGSKQLEHISVPFLYRDIYFGSALFSGQEIVECDKLPIWSMVYSGGASESINDGAELAEVYIFLRKALMLVNTATIFRGPSYYKDEDFEYINSWTGSIEKFSGNELINKGSRMVYGLQYSGGSIR